MGYLIIHNERLDKRSPIRRWSQDCGSGRSVWWVWDL